MFVHLFIYCPICSLETSTLSVKICKSLGMFTFFIRNVLGSKTFTNISGEEDGQYFMSHFGWPTDLIKTLRWEEGKGHRGHLSLHNSPSHCVLTSGGAHFSWLTLSVLRAGGGLFHQETSGYRSPPCFPSSMICQSFIQGGSTVWSRVCQSRFLWHQQHWHNPLLSFTEFPDKSLSL